MTSPHLTTGLLGLDRPLTLEGGRVLEEFQIAYQFYGKLNEAQDNAILICHALSGDQYVASPNPVTGRAGWWTEMVGPGKPIDTDQYFVICSNVLGGCMGSDGPASINPKTGKNWGIDFPLITIGDMVEAQARLIDHLNIRKLFSVIGGSMGGMQVMEWMRRFPTRVHCAVAMATSYRQHVQNIAFHVAGRQAVTSDPDWINGAYAERGTFPTKGLAVARMIAHVTYLSPDDLNEKFGRRLQDRSFRTYDFGVNFQIESYLNHQGQAFTERFDPNSYLYVTLAVDFFDQAESRGGNLEEVYAEAFRNEKPPICLISFSSDWMYPPTESRIMEAALRSAGIEIEGRTLEAKGGHDAFLLKNEELEEIIRLFLIRQRRRLA
jgi:homoserine O-acetyltransferase